MEDGSTIYGTKLKYKFDPKYFPLFSWKGYMQFSPAQVTLKSRTQNRVDININIDIGVDIDIDIDVYIYI